MKEENEFIEGRNYSVEVPSMRPQNYAYVEFKDKNHILTRPGSFKDKEEMRVIFVKPNQIKEIKDYSTSIENYLLELCDKEKEPERFNRLNELWENSLK